VTIGHVFRELAAPYDLPDIWAAKRSETTCPSSDSGRLLPGTRRWNILADSAVPA
jgi:hypothetical protein